MTVMWDEPVLETSNDTRSYIKCFLFRRLRPCLPATSTASSANAGNCFLGDPLPWRVHGPPGIQALLTVIAFRERIISRKLYIFSTDN